MKRSLMSGSEEFSLSPMLGILPRGLAHSGSLANRATNMTGSSAGPASGRSPNLQSLAPSLFARYEKVLALKQASSTSQAGGATSDEMRKRLLAEEQMLKTLLDWLGTAPASSELQHSIEPTEED